jgi:hypothetical protein
MAMYAPDFLNREAVIPVLFILGWQKVTANDWGSDIEGKIDADQFWACFDAVTKDEYDMTQLEEPLLRRGWILVYLYPWTCCDDGGDCKNKGNTVEWSFAVDATHGNYYPLGNKYGTNDVKSGDRCYLTKLFGLNTLDAAFHNVQFLLDDGAAPQLRRYEMHDFLSGCSICGFSSAATMVSRVLQEQLLMAVQANPEAHIPPFQAAIIDGGGTYLCYNNPKNTIGQEGGPVCASNGHAGTDCDAARFPSAESLPDITDQAFKAQCLAFGANSIDTQGHGKTTAAGCGAFGLKDVGCCPALVAEDAWASQNTESWAKCHAKVLVQQMSQESWSYQWSAYFYAWMLHSNGVQTALLQCPGSGHGASWNCDAEPMSTILCLDVFWLDYWGRNEAYRKARGNQSEIEIAQVAIMQYFPAGDCQNLLPGAEKVDCTLDGQKPDQNTCANLKCCWEDGRCWTAAKPFGITMTLPRELQCCTWDKRGSECAPKASA